MAAPVQTAEVIPALNLSALRQMSFADLDSLYRRSKPPRTLADLNGDAQGAMLAWRFPERGPLAWALRKFGASASFPWKGKSFQAPNNEVGEGINRVSFFGKRRWFPFATRFAPSFLDGQPAFLLDYNRAGNPGLIRKIVDEVREVSPGIYMGPAALLVKGRPRPILFFAVAYR